MLALMSPRSPSIGSLFSIPGRRVAGAFHCEIHIDHRGINHPAFDQLPIPCEKHIDWSDFEWPSLPEKEPRDRSYCGSDAD